MLLTFFLTVIGWVIFRAESIGQAWTYFCGIFNKSLFTVPWLINKETYLAIFVSAAIMFLLEWLNRGEQHGFVLPDRMPGWGRCVVCAVLAIIIVRFSGTPSAFIYFAF